MCEQSLPSFLIKRNFPQAKLDSEINVCKVLVSYQTKMSRINEDFKWVIIRRHVWATMLVFLFLQGPYPTILSDTNMQMNTTMFLFF